MNQELVYAALLFVAQRDKSVNSWDTATEAWEKKQVLGLVNSRLYLTGNGRPELHR